MYYLPARAASGLLQVQSMQHCILVLLDSLMSFSLWAVCGMSAGECRRQTSLS